MVELLSPVRPVGDTADAGASDIEVAADAFARVALGVAIEPGDLEAGRLLDVLGPAGLLRAIVGGVDAALILDALRHAGDDFARSGDEGADPEVSADAPRERDTSHEPYLPGETHVTDGPKGQRSRTARSERRIAECLARWRSRLSLNESVRVLERAARLGSQLLTPSSSAWPDGFALLEGAAPLALWVRGDPARLERLDRSVALVGARASTAYGEHVAMETAAGLADRGFAVVSGGAYGIDAAAHRAALASGGLTVAFLAGGVDRLYPAGNSDLLRRIAADGVLAAELPPAPRPPAGGS